MPTIPNFSEFGTSGLRVYAGQIYDSVLLKLQGPDRNDRLRAMAETDDVVGGVLKTFETLGRSVKWWVEPGDETPEQKERAEWIWDAFNDCSHSFDDLIANAYSVLEYGFAPFEIVYKFRRGPEKTDGKFRSSFTDNLIGWRKFALRTQTSIDRWFFDENGGIVALEQYVEGDQASQGGDHSSTLRRIPIQKLILIRTTTKRGSPEGRAVTESAYRTWYKKTHLEDVEAIAAENNMVGIPQQEMPDTIQSFGDANQSAEAQEALRILTTIRHGTATGILRPNGWGPIELIKSPGPAVVDTDKLVRRYDSRIVISMLAGFLLTGMDKHGSFALSSNQFDLLLMAAHGYNAIIADPFNRFAIPRLMRLNGWPTNVTPKLRFGDPDLSTVEEAIRSLEALGKLGSEVVLAKSIQRKLLSKVGLDPEEEEFEEAMEREEENRERSDELRDQLPFPNATGTTPKPSPDQNDDDDGDDDDDGEE